MQACPHWQGRACSVGVGCLNGRSRPPTPLAGEFVTKPTGEILDELPGDAA